jgi:hypothetical protein
VHAGGAHGAVPARTPSLRLNRAQARAILRAMGRATGNATQTGRSYHAGMFHFLVERQSRRDGRTDHQLCGQVAGLRVLLGRGAGLGAVFFHARMPPGSPRARSTLRSRARFLRTTETLPAFDLVQIDYYHAMITGGTPGIRGEL